MNHKLCLNCRLWGLKYRQRWLKTMRRVSSSSVSQYIRIHFHLWCSSSSVSLVFALTCYLFFFFSCFVMFSGQMFRKAGSFVLLLVGSLVVKNTHCVKGTLVLSANSTDISVADTKNNQIIMPNCNSTIICVIYCVTSLSKLLIFYTTSLSMWSDHVLLLSIIDYNQGLKLTPVKCGEKINCGV